MFGPLVPVSHREACAPRRRPGSYLLFASGLLGLVLWPAACSRGGAGEDPDKVSDMRRGTRYDFSDDYDPQDLSATAPADLLGLDLRGVDLAPPRDLAAAAGDLAGRPPCMRGSGWAAFRFKYSGSTSASLEAFGLPDRSNWEAVPAFSTSFTDALHGGGINIASGNWILIRFSLEGLTRISGATLSIYGRSYNTTASGSFRAWSPLYGDISSPANSVSNAWPYTWTSVDYTANVRVGDAKGLTGIRLYAGPSSSDLVINTVELCIDAS
ncbi:MAG: hypothetical protein U1A78_38445 [Polyangia bacterium]